MAATNYATWPKIGALSWDRTNFPIITNDEFTHMNFEGTKQKIGSCGRTRTDTGLLPEDF